MRNLLNVIQSVPYSVESESYVILYVNRGARTVISESEKEEAIG
jgi:hypothetical protein